jgi:hypothetical protein
LTRIKVASSCPRPRPAKSTWQGAEALINISNPDFREELIKDAEALGIWRRSNRMA